jgi:hypothetical protein
MAREQRDKKIAQLALLVLGSALQIAALALIVGQLGWLVMLAAFMLAWGSLIQSKFTKSGF